MIGLFKICFHNFLDHIDFDPDLNLDYGNFFNAALPPWNSFRIYDYNREENVHNKQDNVCGFFLVFEWIK